MHEITTDTFRFQLILNDDSTKALKHNMHYGIFYEINQKYFCGIYMGVN